jgi:hypothetical protein
MHGQPIISAQIVRILSQINPVHATSLYFLIMYYKIIPPLPADIQNGHFA